MGLRSPINFISMNVHVAHAQPKRFQRKAQVEQKHKLGLVPGYLKKIKSRLGQGEEQVMYAASSSLLAPKKYCGCTRQFELRVAGMSAGCLDGAKKYSAYCDSLSC
jgi:hypothetical protein